MAAAIDYFAENVVIGENPLEIERLYWEMWERTTRVLGGLAHVALAGIDNALWDIKAKSLDVPVYELLGAKKNERVRLYWSHCGTHRIFRPDVVGVSHIDSYDGIAKLGEEVVRRGFTALKINIINPVSIGHGYAWNRMNKVSPSDIDEDTLGDAMKIVSTFREAVGPDIEIALDAACKFNTTGAIKLGRAMEPYNLLFLEEPIPPDDPEACLNVKEGTSTPICMSEGLYSTAQYRPYLELGAIDVAMPDIAWVGLTQGKKIAGQCEKNHIPVTPHSPHSPLCTLITAHFSVSIKNLLIQKIEVDDVAWRDKVISEPLKIKNGYLEQGEKLGYGVELNLNEIRRHPPK